MKPVFRRQFLEFHGLHYDEALRIGEDYIFLASALAKGGRCVVEPLPAMPITFARVDLAGARTASCAGDAPRRRGIPSQPCARPARLEAQARRTRSLKEAASFLSLVQHLKDRSPLKATIAALRDPSALRLLKMPLIARLRRLARLFQSREEVGRTG